jgi:ketosteroid isomerase-like protein
MAEHPNAALVREGLEAFNAGQMDAMAEFIADDVEWNYIGGTEPIRGKAAMLESQGSGSVDFTITADIHDVVANDDHAIALVDATATRGGKTFKYRTAEIMHIKDGKLTERWAFSDDTAAIVAFFA